MCGLCVKALRVKLVTTFSKIILTFHFSLPPSHSPLFISWMLRMRGEEKTGPSTQDLITYGSQRKQDQRNQSNLVAKFLRERAVAKNALQRINSNYRSHFQRMKFLDSLKGKL